MIKVSSSFSNLNPPGRVRVRLRGILTNYWFTVIYQLDCDSSITATNHPVAACEMLTSSSLSFKAPSSCAVPSNSLSLAPYHPPCTLCSANLVLHVAIMCSTRIRPAQNLTKSFEHNEHDLGSHSQVAICLLGTSEPTQEIKTADMVGCVITVLPLFHLLSLNSIFKTPPYKAPKLPSTAGEP